MDLKTPLMIRELYLVHNSTELVDTNK